jgi:hypothetical protein
MRRKIIYNPSRDYYSILGIETNASTDEIRRAYRRSVRQVHPDLHPDQADWATAQIQLINEAYGVLRNPSQRREYDSQRWPHLRTRPETAHSTYHSPFRAPDYNPDRPWWEQVERHAPRRYPFAENIPSSPPDAVPKNGQPSWLAVSAWLQNHHLGFVEPTWLTLVGIWRSPYASLLSVLSALLALNVAVLIYMAIAPQGFGDLLPPDTLTPYLNPVFPVTTPDQLYPECSDPNVQITDPVKYELVGNTFSVIGTVQHPDLSYYLIQVGYMASSTVVPERWRTVRSRPINQSLREESIEDGILADSISMLGRLPGYYAVRLRVVLQDQTELQPCDVVIRH